MKNVIPFTKEITFDNKISEITSISLEENYNCTFLSNLIVTDQLNTVRKITMYIMGEING